MVKEFKFHFEFTLEVIIKVLWGISSLVVVFMVALGLFHLIDPKIVDLSVYIMFLIATFRYWLYDSKGILTKKE